MSSVLVGMFDSQTAADEARGRLMSAGFAADAVRLTGGMATSSSSQALTGVPSVEEPQHEGAIARFFESIFGGGSDDKDDLDRAGYTDTYKEAFRRGSYSVSVSTGDSDEMDKAERILNDCGAVDIDTKAESWRKEGWAGGAFGATASGEGTGSTLEDGATHKLQEVEEELKVGKRAVAKGGVRIFTRMTEAPVSETVVLRDEHVDVKRTNVDRPATEADFAAFKEGSIEVRAMSEEALVSKTARVTGEVEIGKTSTDREETVRDTVRRTTVDIEQLEGEKGVMGSKNAVVADEANRHSDNRDPITGTPGAHPVGTGVGAVAGGVAAGAAAGTVAGPVGTVVGAAVGAVAGGLAGKGVAEQVDPTFVKSNRPL